MDEFMNKSPPGTSMLSNLSKEGPFIVIRTSHSVTRGDAIGSWEMLTVQFAVPPRISGPYEGIHDTYWSSNIAA